MIQKFDAWAVTIVDELHALLRKWFELERPLFLRSDLLELLIVEYVILIPTPCQHAIA